MQTLDALSDPTRRHIVEMLAQGTLAAGEIARCFDMSGAAVSQHLKILLKARLVKVHPRGRSRIYELNPVGVQDLADWVASIQKFWTPRLDALERALVEDKKRSKL